MPRLRRWLPILLALIAPLWGTTAAQAATPSSGSISPTDTTVSWSGGPVTGSAGDPLAADCSNSPCDLFGLTITGSDPGLHAVTVRIDWTSPTNDLDLHVVDAVTGAIVETPGRRFPLRAVTFPGDSGLLHVQALF